MWDMVTHPAYQKIIGMGRDVVPLILEDLRRGVDQWFWALHCITEADPVEPEAHGDVNRMAEKWLEWGERHGYIPPDQD